MARPATAASATIWPALAANGSVQKTRKRTTSAETITRLRESRSTSGPTVRPIAIAGRKSAISSAAIQLPECVRSHTSRLSATNAIQLPRPEPNAA